MESEEQHIRIRAILEILGKPKDYIEGKTKEYIEKIKEDENLMLLNERISEPKEQGKVWSIFAEIEVIIKGVTNLIGFCIDYMPSSIEIIKPDKFGFENRVFTNFINDLLAKLHRVDMIAKQLGTENNFLKKNMNGLIKNNVLVLVKFGVNKLETISKATGVEQEEVRGFVDKLIEEGRIKEEEGVYSII
ncbi:MAG: hypothetical protein KAK00_07145 [Nanoarchaeota archaeon]|nr:hypothetical protein [Nanoarchaeota archaeon]